MSKSEFRVNLPRCEECDIELHGRDVYFDGEGSRCRKCDGPVGNSGGRMRRHSTTGEHVVPLPPSVKVERPEQGDNAGALIFTVPWRIQAPQDGLRLFGWIVVTCVGLAAIQFGTGKLGAFALAASVLVTLMAVRWINRTIIVVKPDEIRVSHRPFPAWSRAIETKRLEQLYVNRRPIAQKEYDYSVRALLDDGRDIVFLRALKEPAVAFYLERCIEQHLEIDDKRVRGEYTAPPPPHPSESSPYMDS